MVSGMNKAASSEATHVSCWRISELNVLVQLTKAMLGTPEVMDHLNNTPQAGTHSHAPLAPQESATMTGGASTWHRCSPGGEAGRNETATVDEG